MARTGTATIELALCLPLMTVLLLGTIDACHITSTRHILSLAAHQASRKAADFRSTSAEVKAECTRFLDTQHVHGTYEIRTQPSEVATAAAGEPVTVEVTCNVSRHCFVIDIGKDTYEITASFTALRHLPRLPNFASDSLGASISAGR